METTSQVNLRELRDAHGLTRPELVKLTPLNAITVARIERIENGGKMSSPERRAFEMVAISLDRGVEIKRDPGVIGQKLIDAIRPNR